MAIVTLRSYLYVPGDRQRMLDQALERGADAIIVDLEDAVAATQKAAARRQAARWLAGTSPSARTEIWVRVNPVGPDSRDAAADIAAVTGPALTGVCLPKCESGEHLARAAELLAAAEVRAGLAPGCLRVAPLIESACGILAMPAIAQGPRVSHLHIGEADLMADLGIQPGPDELELLPARWQAVVASAAARLDAPVGPVCRDFRDLDRLRTSSERLRRLGFGGRTLIHPAQVRVVNDVFTPTVAEEAAAKSLLARFESATSAGVGVITDDGQMVDEAVVRAARRTLKLVSLRNT